VKVIDHAGALVEKLVAKTFRASSICVSSSP